MPVVSPMKVLYFETTRVNSVTKQCIRKPGISEIAWSWPKFPLPRRGSRPEPQKPMKFAVSRRRISMRPLRSAYYGEDQKNAPRVMRPCSGTLRDSAQFVVSNSPISRTGEDTCGKSTSRRGRRLKDILVALPLECSSLGHASFAESTSPKPRSYIPKSAFRFSSSHIFNTMDDQSALKEVATLWGTTSPMAPMSDDELVKDQPHKFPKTRGQFGLRAAKRAWEPRSAPTQVPAQQLQMMAKIIARHETALQLLEADRSWILFMEAGELGIIPQLMQTTATWKKSRTQGTCKCGLRQALMGALLMELVARLQKLGADAPAQQRLSKAKLLSTEPLAWHYVKWNQDKQCHEPAEAAPLLHDNAIKSTQVLTEHMVRDGVIHAFHALGGMAADKDKTTMFKLTLSMEGPKKQQIREALIALSDSAALRLIGARLRPERSHRQLPKELQAMIQDAEL